MLALGGVIDGVLGCKRYNNPYILQWDNWYWMDRLDLLSGVKQG